MNHLARKYSHSWQWPVVILSFLAGILHIWGALRDDFDPSIASGDLPMWVNFGMGAILLIGSIYMVLSLCKNIDMLKGLAREQLGLGFLALSWACQSIATILTLPDRPIPWLAYLAISIGCVVRHRSAAKERDLAIAFTSADTDEDN